MAWRMTFELGEITIEITYTTTIVIQILPEVPTSHDRYANFYQQAKFTDGHPHNLYFGTPLNVPFWLQISFYIFALRTHI